MVTILAGNECTGKSTCFEMLRKNFDAIDQSYKEEVNIYEIEKEITTKHADFVIGNYQNCTEDGVLQDNPVFDKTKYTNFKLDIKDYKKSFYIMNSSACNKIFRLPFIEKLNLRFVEGVPAEDAIFDSLSTCYSKSSNKTEIIIIYHYKDNKPLQATFYLDGDKTMLTNEEILREIYDSL